MKRDFATMELFPEASPPPPQSYRHHSEITSERAFSDEVRCKIMDVFATRPACWLEWKDFSHIMSEYGISSYFGHVMHHLVREDVIAEKVIYFGTKKIGPNYYGFGHKWGSSDTPGPFFEERLSSARAGSARAALLNF